MKIFKIFIILLFLLSPHISQANEAGGPPKAEELVGFWKMEPWPNPDVQKINPWPMPYQWFGFYEDGRLYSMMKTEGGDYTAKDLHEIFTALNMNPPRYELHGQFLTVNDPNIDGYEELWGVNLFSRDLGSVAKKGDLVMSLAGGKDGAPVYYRLLRKVK